MDEIANIMNRVGIRGCSDKNISESEFFGLFSALLFR